MTQTLRSLFVATLVAAPLAAQIHHPTPANLQARPTATISRTDTLSGDPATDALARRLRALRPVRKLGGEDAVGGADWGRIADVAIDRKGRILVLDEQDKSISRWTFEGRAEGRFGRTGGGPLEFQSPAFLAIGGDDTLIVADRMTGIRRFAWTSTPVSLATWTPGKSYRDLCAGPLGVVGRRPEDDGTVAQIFGPDGERVRGIGARYISDNAFTARLLSEGRLGCLPNGSVVGTNIILPYVWIWDRAGQTLATVELVSFTPMTVTDVDNGLRYSTPEGGYDAVRRIVPIGPDHFLVQLFYQDAASIRERAEYREVRTYLLSSRTGRGLYLGTSLPVIAGERYPRLVGWRNDPMPEVMILE